jgi:hypothetical protein
MAKSKNKKDHKKRVEARNQRIKEQRLKFQKVQQEMLMKLIDQEKNKGMFDNLPNIGPPGGDINIDGPLI